MYSAVLQESENYPLEDTIPLCTVFAVRFECMRPCEFDLRDNMR